MKTLGRKSDFRVMVMPRGMGDFGGMSLSTRLLYGNTELEQARLERDEKERCEEIASAIKRHTDNVAWTEIVFEQERLCSHCGATWTEASDTYNGGCCDADEQGHEAAGAAPLLDEPSEPELAQQVADDKQQAITDARVAAIGEQR